MRHFGEKKSFLKLSLPNLAKVTNHKANKKTDNYADRRPLNCAEFTVVKYAESDPLSFADGGTRTVQLIPSVDSYFV